LVNGAGSCQTSSTPPGADTVTATYSGNTSFAPSSGSVTLVVTSGDYTPLLPIRVCDTRPGNISGLSGPAAQCDGPNYAGSPVGAGGTKVINVAGNFGVPADATAVMLNVTAVSPATPGYLTVYPTGTPRPDASNLHFGTGEVVPNLVEVGTGTNGDISFTSSAPTNLVVDVEGYVASAADSGPGASLYNPLSSPARICDTRVGNPSSLTGGSAQCNGPNDNGDPLVAGGMISVQVAGVGGVPSNASAAILNVTDVNPTTAGYMTVFPSGTTPPTASNLNFAAGQVTANRVIVPLSANGSITISSSQSADVVVDVSGYFSSTGGTGAQYTTEVEPVRICDTRAGNISNLSGADAQCNGRTIGPGGTLTVQVTGMAGVPANAKAVVVNLTAVNPTTQTYLSVYPGTTKVNASDLNPGRGEIRANVVVSAVTPNGTITISNAAGSVDVVADVQGWYS
jgi:hypothetical protein